MLLHDARREARFADGELVLLDDQDPALWDAEQIARGRAALDRALALRGRGPYVLQAAIAVAARRRAARLAADRRALRRARAPHRLAGGRAQPRGRGRRGRAGRRRACVSSTTWSCPTTATCTRPAASCCDGSAAPARRARRTSARWRSCTTTPSAGCSSAGWRRSHELVAPRRHLPRLSALVRRTPTATGSATCAGIAGAPRPPDLARRRRRLAVADLPLADEGLRLRHLRPHRRRAAVRHARRLRRAGRRRARARAAAAARLRPEPHVGRAPVVPRAPASTTCWADEPPQQLAQRVRRAGVDARPRARPLLLPRLPARAARPRLAQPRAARGDARRAALLARPRRRRLPRRRAAPGAEGPGAARQPAEPGLPARASRSTTSCCRSTAPTTTTSRR